MVCVTDIAAHGQPEQLAHEVVFEAGAGDLPLVIQVLRPDEADDAVYQEWIERPRHAVCAGFKSQLIDAMVSFGGECASLPGFEVHCVAALPLPIPLAMML